jgi:DGQHR domain-containing protein
VLPDLSPTDKKILEIFRIFGIPCYGDHGQIEKHQLFPNASPGDHLEIDFVAMVGEVGLFIEATAQARDNRVKIKKFVAQTKEFLGSTVSPKKKMKLLKGIPASKRGDFAKLTRWIHVYFGTSNELIEDTINDKVCPNDNLKVFNYEHIQYLRFLARRIGKFGKYELLNRLDIQPSEVRDRLRKQSTQAIPLKNRKISQTTGLVDLYVFAFPVLDLLKVARVVRYGSLNSWTPELGTRSYQRILSRDKLEAIQGLLNAMKEKATFPNAITAILSTDCNPTTAGGETTIEIPLRYGSIEVIDGQHRLFAYAKTTLSEEALSKAQLIVVGLRFDDSSSSKLTKWSAKTFVEINKSQTKVPKDLILLIENSVMGERTPEALGARVLIELNRQTLTPLYNVFRTRPFQVKNRVGGPPVKIVTVVNDLANLLDERNNNNPQRQSVYDTFTPLAWNALKSGHETSILGECKKLLNQYFKQVSTIFSSDWSSKRSIIFTSNYIAAFCRLLITFREQNYDLRTMKRKIEAMPAAIQARIISTGRGLGPSGELFWKENSVATGVLQAPILGPRSSSIQIHEFLKTAAGM